MKPDKKKDALTDLVDVSTSPEENADAKLSDDQAVTPSGDVVTLGFEKEINALAKKLVKITKKKNNK